MLLTSSVLHFHDSAHPHTAAYIQELLQPFQWEHLEHLSCSPNLAPRKEKKKIHIARDLFILFQDDKLRQRIQS